jgi:hypothetical protein
VNSPANLQHWRQNDGLGNTIIDHDVAVHPRLHRQSAAARGGAIANTAGASGLAQFTPSVIASFVLIALFVALFVAAWALLVLKILGAFG